MNVDAIVSPVDGEMLVKKGKKMNPIYCFLFNDVTGEIRRLDIPTYNVRTNQYTGRKCYSFPNCISKDGKTYYVTDEKFDRFTNNKVFSFNGSYNDAYRVVRNTLTTKGARAHREYKRCEYLLSLLKEIDE